MAERIKKSDEEWKRTLTPEEYRVLRKKGTEMPFTGKLLGNSRKGVYVCAACANELFDSETKFDSGSGWPSFYAPKGHESVEEQPDRGPGMERTEVLCARCGGHLDTFSTTARTLLASGIASTLRRFSSRRRSDLTAHMLDPPRIFQAH